VKRHKKLVFKPLDPFDARSVERRADRKRRSRAEKARVWRERIDSHREWFASLMPDDWDGIFREGQRISCGCWGTLVEDGKTVGGFPAKAGQTFYSQMAPAYIEQVIDQEHFIVVIDYPKGTDNPAHHVLVEHHNGIRLWMELTDISPSAEDYDTYFGRDNDNEEGGEQDGNATETADVDAAVGAKPDAAQGHDNQGQVR